MMKHDRRAGPIIWQGSSWALRAEPQSARAGVYTKAIVDHPGAVVLVPLLGTGDAPEVLMLEQYRPALDETILEVPAGTRGWHEPWLSCAQRELREETGYRAAQFTSLGHCWPAPGLSNELMAIFLATGLAEDPLPQDEDEAIVVTRKPLPDLVMMALDGRLRDAKSSVALLRTAQHLGLLRGAQS